MIYVIEPHCDDAFLSLHEYIKTFKPSIVSVFGDKKRYKESEKYSAVMGVPHYIVRDEEGLKKFLKKLDPDLDVVLVPVAIEHKEHQLVRRIVEKNFCGYMYYYVDQPYGMKVKNSKTLWRMLIMKKLEWFSRPNARKWQYSKIYKSQAKLFYYNETLLKNSFEMVVRE